MRCPFCEKPETRVLESRLNQTGEITRRRRECGHCDGRFTTYERVEELLPDVIKKDGRREPFQREKLQSGLAKACEKRPFGLANLEEIVQRIEKRVLAMGLREIPSEQIGTLVMAELHQLDPVAYVRFASVYREFKDVHEFVNELKQHPFN